MKGEKIGGANIRGRKSMIESTDTRGQETRGLTKNRKRTTREGGTWIHRRKPVSWKSFWEEKPGLKKPCQKE